MLKFGLLLSALFYLAWGSGQFVVVQSPASLQFSGNDPIEADHISEVLVASLGHTPQTGSNWPGLVIKDPFGFPDAVTVIAVEGVSSIGDFEAGSVYPIIENKNERAIWRVLQQDVMEHNPSKSVSRIDFSNLDMEFPPEALKDMDTSDLIEEDLYFHQEMAALRKYIDTTKQNGISGDLPQINWFVLPNLHVVSDVRGPDDRITISFKKQLRETIIEYAKQLKETTKGKALVVVIIGDAAHTRQVRAAGDPVANNTSPGNRATVFTSNYPAIFNIMLWFGVTLVLSLIAISYFIATMDPGRDSIIYRMTSNRMKKDS